MKNNSSYQVPRKNLENHLTASSGSEDEGLYTIFKYARRPENEIKLLYHPGDWPITKQS